MPEAIRITRIIAVVLRVFLDDINADQYGAALMKTTGLPSGTLYPALARLDRAGWLTSTMEDVDPHEAGRPPRRYLRLHPDVIDQARHELAALRQQLGESPP